MQASASYPVHFLPAYHEQQSRLATLLRALLAIPHQIVAGIYGYLAYLVSIVAWFAILITGRYPASLFRLNEGYVRYQARVNAYTWLLNDRFPPFGPGSPGDGYPLRAGVDGRRRSRASRPSSAGCSSSRRRPSWSCSRSS